MANHGKPPILFVMIWIRFSDAETEKRGLGDLAGRFSGKTWKSGETLVPEEALSHLAAAGIKFSVEGHLSYEKVYAPLRDPASAAV
ncbi:MAG: hypothetical protein WDN28_11575 [Chthoniobacter sp.]